MNMLLKFNLIVVSGLVILSPVNADDGGCSDKRCGKCEEQCESRCQKTKQRCWYCPRCTVYQDSSVYEEIGDDPASSWPSRQDGNFSDELSR